ncbi:MULTISPECIES: Asp23/Gls24 family envelope stress response protein [Peptoniphilus]|uniref:Asp23/Gls24 family envelope stress response protein n=1 Tax=Peptoniphilus TaxID=162289 RepID=UPI000287FD25|nr:MULTISPECIES: Asp23/Gls24 family envelope stress response protein [Peptoniphilus]MBS6610131.1 Asp23/Gls24 family envelope stress response protein [Peptoniphilus harei]MDU1043379.1 Asp23/Gls24 family envelope stress response protein [Peptoniphilus rhinitidis]MDU1954095.1 Asp23/Gls24 family envelope stress response protein [Peptoniphilus lacydonensis]MDU2109562.1 Asp23/Gls24 family envelope stress response protein [Peptoniphilus lacydonensis]MDU2115334.1 Asp23/Gls24 family envelope stress res
MDNKYLVNGNEAEGKVKISEDVIATVASVAAESVDGVVKVSTNFKSQMSDILNTKNFARGVKVNIGEKETIVDVYITIEYGIKIVEVSEKVQEQVKEAIENMTDFDVVEVNVHISGIAVKDSEKTIVK